jgi:hypothetical protein
MNLVRSIPPPRYRAGRSGGRIRWLIGTGLAVVLVTGLVYGPKRRGCFFRTKSDIASLTMAKYAHEAYPAFRATNPGRACPIDLYELNPWMNNKAIVDPWGTSYVMYCADAPKATNATDRADGLARPNASDGPSAPDRAIAPASANGPDRVNAPEGADAPDCVNAPDCANSPDNAKALDSTPRFANAPDRANAPGSANHPPQRAGHMIIVRSAGEDGRFGTADDLWSHK